MTTDRRPLLRTRRLTAAPAAIEDAARVLRAGGLAAFPTETVYGLGADALNEEAVAAIFLAKGRPAFNPLIAHVVDLAAAEQWGVFDAQARALARAFWPGPLTLVVPATADGVSLTARAGLDSVALRAPAHPVAQALLRALGRPVAAPSANRSGAVSPTDAEHVAADLDGRIDLILDGGPTSIGVESTILACLDGAVRLLRPGGLPRDAIEDTLGRSVETAAPTDGGPLAPGMLVSHYAPRAALRLNAAFVEAGEAALDFAGRFGAAVSPDRPPRLDLSPGGDLDEAAAHVFAYLRRLDSAGVDCIAVAPVPNVGIGEAINDRLRRAAAPRAMVPP